MATRLPFTHHTLTPCAMSLHADKTIDITKINTNDRVALRNDSYMLHLVLPSKVDPLVSLMKVEKVLPTIHTHTMTPAVEPRMDCPLRDVLHQTGHPICTWLDRCLTPHTT